MNNLASRNTRADAESFTKPYDTIQDRYLIAFCDRILDNHHRISQIERVAEAFRVGTAGFDPCSLHRVTKR